MGVHRQLCFQMILGSYGASVPPGDGFSASVEGSLLVGDSAVGETDAVQMSPWVPTTPSYIPYIKLEQSSRGEEDGKTRHNKTKEIARSNETHKLERISK